MKYCSNCGTRLEDGANFCTACGKKQSAMTADSDQTAPAVQTPAEIKPEPVADAPETATQISEDRTAFVLGIVSTSLGGFAILLAFTVGIFGLLFGVGALVCAVIARKRSDGTSPLPKVGLGLSIGAIVCSVIIIIINILSVFILFSMLASFEESFSELLEISV